MNGSRSPGDRRGVRTLGASPVLGLLDLDRTSPVPLYFQVAGHLQAASENGTLPPGTQFASELRLAEELGLSRPTVRRALAYLVERGLLVRRRGVGTEVVKPRVRRPLELTSLYDDLAAAGQRPTTRVLTNERIAAPADVAEALGLPEGAPVIRLVRLRSASGQAIARMTNHLPADRFEVSSQALEQHGLYRLLRSAGITLHAANQAIGARRATVEEARTLNESRGAALLTMQRITYAIDDSVIEFGSHIYAASRYSFEISLLTTS